MLAIFLFLLLGAVNGIIAGLLGIGGGSVIVPMLVAIFPLLDIAPVHIQHLALGTSLATIVVTAISSTRAQHKRQAVRWDVVRHISIGILLGTFLGSLGASTLSGNFLTIFFVVFLYSVAAQMLLDIKPKPSSHLPGFWGMSFVGSVIGIISSLVGIGGGSLTVPFLVRCNVAMHTAVGTSAAVGFPIAVAGTLGYILGGLDATHLPQGTLGYVHIWAFICISVASYITAPMGVKLSHKLPIKILKRVFALFLISVATNMITSII